MLDKILTMLIVLIIEIIIGFLLVHFTSIEIVFLYSILCALIDTPLVEILDEN